MAPQINRRSILKGTVASLALLMTRPFQVWSKDMRWPEGLTDVKVTNAGVGGNNTIDLLNRIDQDCLSLKPDLTILMVGTNDMNSVKHIPLDEYGDNLDQLVKRIKASGSKLLVMNILPTYEPYLLTRHSATFYQPEGVQGRREQVNEVVKKIAERQRVHFLDLGHRFEAIGKIGLDRDSLIQNEVNSNKTDGIHPTANGYRFIALTIYDYISFAKLPSANIVCFGDSITKGDGTTSRDSYPAYLKKLLQDEK